MLFTGSLFGANTASMPLAEIAHIDHFLQNMRGEFIEYSSRSKD